MLVVYLISTYLLIVFLAESIVRITDIRERCEDEVMLTIGIIIWPISLVCLAIVFGIICMWDRYTKWFIAGIKNKYKKYKWKKKNKEAFAKQKRAS